MALSESLEGEASGQVAIGCFFTKYHLFIPLPFLKLNRFILVAVFLRCCLFLSLDLRAQLLDKSFILAYVACGFPYPRSEAINHKLINLLFTMALVDISGISSWKMILPCFPRMVD